MAKYLNLIVVFVSCDFELGRNVSCEESTVSQSHTGLICVHFYVVVYVVYFVLDAHLLLLCLI